TGEAASLTIEIRSRNTGTELAGDISFRLEGGESLPPTDHLICTPSLTVGCGVVARFSAARSRSGPPTVLEAQLDDGVFRITDSAGFETFVESVIRSRAVAIKVRVDQKS